jgi:hypothetical protein
MNFKHYLYLLFFSISPFFTKAQNHTFHKVLNLPNQFVERPNNIKFFNNTYYITGHTQQNNETNLLFLTLDTLGNVLNTIYHIDTPYVEAAGFSQSKLDTNINGNFFIHYTKWSNSEYALRHERVELDTTGQIIFKKTLDTLDSDLMSFRAYSRIAIDNPNQVYYTLDNILPCDTCQDNAERIILAKFSQTNNELLWMKKWLRDTTNSIYKFSKDLLLCENGDILIVYDTQRYGFFYPINYQHSKINFERYSPSGALVSQKTIQPHSYSWSSYGGTFVENEKAMVVCYTNSTAIYPDSGPDYWELKPTVAKLDSNFNVVWQKNLGGLDYTPGNLFPDRLISNFEVVGDTSTVGAHFFVDTLFNGFLRIEKRKIANGELDWERRYCYTAPGVVDSMVLFDIGDVEKTPDGGFVIIGQAEFYDSFNVSPQYLYGYVMKTNCLGFLGDPSANFTAIPDKSFGVNFTNMSLMGGGYLWDFGDGTSLFTGENMDFDSAQPIFHQYSDTGKYSVLLIAYGCNGANDTLRSTIHITPEPNDTNAVNPNITNYIALGPNPVKSGESISVYVCNLPSENCSLSFYDYQGKLVLQNKLPQSKSTYIIPLIFAIGIYQAVLRNGNDELEVEKVVVL